MKIRNLLLLALGASSLAGCAALVAGPVLLPLLAFPPSLGADNTPKVTDVVSPVPDEAIFYDIRYEDRDVRYPAPPEAEASMPRSRAFSVYGVEEDYGTPWQSVGESQTFLSVQDVNLKYSDGSVGKRRIVRLKATSENPGVAGANPSFTGVRQAWPRAAYTTRVIYTPQKDGDRAGILAWQNHQHYAFCGATRKDGKPVAVLARRFSGAEPSEGVILASYPLDTQSFKTLGFRIEIQDGALSCAFVDKKHGLFSVGSIPGAFPDAPKSLTDQGILIGAHAYRPAP